METRTMQEIQLSLMELDDTYSLIGLKESCRVFIKHKYPHAVREESQEEYNEFIEDETNLEFAIRLRKIADQIEKMVLGK